MFSGTFRYPSLCIRMRKHWSELKSWLNRIHLSMASQTLVDDDTSRVDFFLCFNWFTCAKSLTAIRKGSCSSVPAAVVSRFCRALHDIATTTQCARAKCIRQIMSIEKCFFFHLLSSAALSNENTFLRNDDWICNNYTLDVFKWKSKSTVSQWNN